MMATYVAQKHHRGSGIACLAMILSVDYDTIAEEFAHYLGDLDVYGPTLAALDDYLADHDRAVRRFNRYYSLSSGPSRTPWPPEPFGDLHLCEVLPPNASTTLFVVMLDDGTILDPTTEEPKELEDYVSVSNVAAVIDTTPPEPGA